MQFKLLLATCIAACTISSVDAQIKKGATLLGGQLGFSSTTTDYQSTTPSSVKNSSISISPTFGKALKENLVVGADFTFGYGKFGNKNSIEQINTGYGLGFFIRQYKELGKGFYLFGQGRLGGNYTRLKQTGALAPAGGEVGKDYNIQLTFYPGIAYSATRRLQLEAGLNNMVAVQYAHSSNLSTKSDGFSLSTSLNSAMSNFTIGFRILLN